MESVCNVVSTSNTHNNTVLVFPQADLRSELGDRGYLAFGVILFIWELLPTSLLILIFRVRQPPQEDVSFCSLSLLTSPLGSLSLCFTSPTFGFHLCSPILTCFFLLSQGCSMPNSNRVPRPYFFDDPAGEDADSGVPWVNSSHPHQR